MPDTDSEATDRLAAVLAERYGLEPCQLTQLPIGQGTVNYRADCADREVFVKNYPHHADLPGERAAIGLRAGRLRLSGVASRAVQARCARLESPLRPAAMSGDRLGPAGRWPCP